MSISSNARTGDDRNGSLEVYRLDRFLERVKLESASTGDRPDDLSVADLVRRRTVFWGVVALRSLIMISRKVSTSTDSMNTRFRFLGEGIEELSSETPLSDRWGTAVKGSSSGMDVGEGVFDVSSDPWSTRLYSTSFSSSMSSLLRATDGVEGVDCIESNLTLLGTEPPWSSAAACRLPNIDSFDHAGDRNASRSANEAIVRRGDIFSLSPVWRCLLGEEWEVGKTMKGVRFGVVGACCLDRRGVIGEGRGMAKNVAEIADDF